MLRKIISTITVAAFLLIAFLPVYGLLLPNSTETLGSENRALSEFPSAVPIAQLPGALEDYFEDRFAYRSGMVNLAGAIESMLADSSGGSGYVNPSDNVAYGLDGWMYYMPDGSREDILRTISHSPEKLEAICEAQQAAKDYLDSCGIAYYLMICPDKHTVYPEYLPLSLRAGDGASRFDALAEAIAQRTDVELIDTRAAVIEAKADNEVFYKTDTHWNEHGAYAGYSLLAGRIEQAFPNFRRVYAEDCDITEEPGWTEGDMAKMVNRIGELTDIDVSYIPRDSQVIQIEQTLYADTSPDPDRPILIYENPALPDGPTAVVFRDSFCKMLVPMLSEGFSRVVFVWSTSVINSIVQTEQPDIVIMQYVERYSGSASSGMDISEEKLVDYAYGQLELPAHVASIRSAVDLLDVERDICTVRGWAFLPGKDAVPGEKHIALEKDGVYIYCETSTVTRADVNRTYSDTMGGADLNLSGFTAFFDKRDLSPGTWNLLVIIDDGAGNAGYVELGKRVKIK